MYWLKEASMTLWFDVMQSFLSSAPNNNTSLWPLAFLLHIVLFLMTVHVTLQEGRMVSTSPRCLHVQRLRSTWKWPQRSYMLWIPRASRVRPGASCVTPTCACTRARPWACTSRILFKPLPLHSCPSATPPFPPPPRAGDSQKDIKIKNKLKEERLPASRGAVWS